MIKMINILITYEFISVLRSFKLIKCVAAKKYSLLQQVKMKKSTKFKTDAEFYGPVMGCRILASCEAPPLR